MNPLQTSMLPAFCAIGASFIGKLSILRGNVSIKTDNYAMQRGMFPFRIGTSDCLKGFSKFANLDS